MSITNGKGNYAIVTGASGGIGFAFCELLASYGYDILLIGHDLNRLQHVHKKLSTKYKQLSFKLYSADLCNRESTAHICSLLQNEQNIKVLVNGAGYGMYEEFYSMHMSDISSLLYIHSNAVLMLIHSMIPILKRSSPSYIINVSSFTAFRPDAMNTIYAAIKSFQNTFSIGLRKELQPHGIIVQALCPGFTKTDFYRRKNLEGFNASRIPDSLWLNPTDVVAESLQEIDNPDSNGIVIPGDRYKKIYSLSGE